MTLNSILASLVNTLGNGKKKHGFLPHSKMTSGFRRYVSAKNDSCWMGIYYLFQTINFRCTASMTLVGTFWVSPRKNTSRFHRVYSYTIGLFFHFKIVGPGFWKSHRFVSISGLNSGLWRFLCPEWWQVSLGALLFQWSEPKVGSSSRWFCWTMKKSLENGLKFGYLRFVVNFCLI